MPKPVKKRAPKKNKDENVAAFDAVERLTRSDEPPDFATQLSAHMAKLGAKGGKIGGKRRLVTMTSEQRSTVALKAAQARWGKKRKRSDRS